VTTNLSSTSKLLGPTLVEQPQEILFLTDFLSRFICLVHLHVESAMACDKQSDHSVAVIIALVVEGPEELGLRVHKQGLYFP
jgi:hypothetical protein